MCAVFERYDPAKDEWVTMASMALSLGALHRDVNPLCAVSL